jgi:hypothetical protein
MKPLGRVPSRFPGKTDYRPIGEGVVNWWENEFQCGSKNSDKLLVKKHIDETLRQLEEDKDDYRLEIMNGINSFYYNY